MLANTAHNRMLRPILLFLTICLACGGGISIGYGVYMRVKAAFAEELIRGSWAKVQGGNNDARPWPWADTVPGARLEVPRLGIDQIVLEGVSGRTLAFGPGHVFGTADPGAPGNCVIIGHRDTSFAFLGSLKCGDRIVLHAKNGKSHEYTVSSTRVITRTDTWAMAGTNDPSLTLITCYPFNDITPGDGRYMVRAVLRMLGPGGAGQSFL